MAIARPIAAAALNVCRRRDPAVSLVASNRIARPQSQRKAGRRQPAGIGDRDLQVIHGTAGGSQCGGNGIEEAHAGQRTAIERHRSGDRVIGKITQDDGATGTRHVDGQIPRHDRQCRWGKMRWVTRRSPGTALSLLRVIFAACRAPELSNNSMYELAEVTVRSPVMLEAPSTVAGELPAWSLTAYCTSAPAVKRADPTRPGWRRRSGRCPLSVAVRLRSLEAMA